MSPYILVGFCICALVVGQVLFKIISGHIVSPIDLFRKREALTLLIFALTLYTTATFAWVLALRKLPLSRAYLFNSLTFILVPIAAYIILRESIGLRFFIGSSIVILGIWVAST